MAEVDNPSLFDDFMKEMELIRDNWSQAHEDVEQLNFRGVSENEQIEVIIDGKFQPLSVSFEQAIRAGVGIRGLENGVKNAIADAAKQAETYFQGQIEEAVRLMEANSERKANDLAAGESSSPQEMAPTIKPRLGRAHNDMTVQ